MLCRLELHVSCLLSKLPFSERSHGDDEDQIVNIFLTYGQNWDTSPHALASLY